MWDFYYVFLQKDKAATRKCCKTEDNWHPWTAAQ